MRAARDGMFINSRKNQNFAAFMDSQGIARLLELFRKVNDVNPVFRVKQLVFHLDRGLLLQLLCFSCHLFVTHLIVFNEAVWAIVNGRLAPFVHWYQKNAAGSGMISFARCGCWGAMMTAASAVPAPLLMELILITPVIRLIQRRNSTVPFVIRVFIVWHIRLKTPRPYQIHLLWL